jgi:hypothetical protein
MAVAYEVDDGARAADALAFRAMRAAGVLWLVVAIGGQWLFVYYIVAFFALAVRCSSCRRFVYMPLGVTAGTAACSSLSRLR